MAVTTIRNLQDFAYHVTSPSVGASPVTAAIPVPARSRLTELGATLQGAVTSTETFTAFLISGGTSSTASTAISNGTFSIASTGAGVGITATTTSTVSQECNQGDVIAVVPSGGAGANISATIYGMFHRD